MRFRLIAFLVTVCASSLAQAASLPPEPAAAIPAAVSLAAQPFDLADVRLGDGPFRDAMLRDLAYLLRLDPDRLLHTFRLNVGLPSSAQPYGGWEGPDVELRGHTLGHYLSACSLMYRSTGDQELKRRIDYIVGELAKCQAASPAAGFHEGYLSAYPESFIDRVETGKPVWAPWYTLHKIMAGLLDAHELAGNAPALAILKGMAGWIKFRVDRLTPEQMQASLKTEFGGMNDVLANLYRVTGNPDHLRLARAFDHAAVFDPLARGEDELNGLHANTQIPKVIGAAREFEVTGEPRYRDIAHNFWDDVALHRSYVIGGDSDREHFFPVSDFAEHLSPETAETCNTYNMLKLTRHLFEWQPDARVMDFYERGLYNHILASQDPALGRFVYLMSLAPGHYKTYSTPENSFWCCVGTGMENHAKYGDTIFMHNDRGLLVNLFIPAELNWRERGVVVRQETHFPEEDATRLTLQCGQPAKFALQIRHPGWAQGPLAMTVNGKPVQLASAPGTYAQYERTWRDGDVIEIRFPMGLHVESLPGDSGEVALLYGPIVLAGQLGQDGMPNPYVRDQLDQARYPDPAVPAFVTDATNESWLSNVEMVSHRPLLFRTHGLARPHDVMLAPFYKVHHERYSVYWKVLTPSAWQEHTRTIADLADKRQRLEAKAIDRVQPGDDESEGAHGFTGKNSQSGSVDGRGWRQAQKGGYFSYRLATAGRDSLTLLCVFGSHDTARTFTILADGAKVAMPELDGAAPGETRLEQYPLPSEVVRGKPAVTVTFQAADSWNAATANVFGCALLPGGSPDSP